MRFLIDTNVLISSEPARQDDVEAATMASLDLARAASGDHQLMVHPTIADEIEHDRDAERRRLRQLVRNRYPVLEHPPQIQPRIAAILGTPAVGSHDWYDHLLLACVLGDAVHGLITQDDAIHRSARRLGVGERVHTVADAAAMLARHSAAGVPFIPSVERRPLHAVALADRFFDSLRADYRGFDDWFREKAREGREAFVIDGPDRRVAGICIVKGLDDDIGIGGRVAKVSTLKVADEFKGSRFGELLLKALFQHAHSRFDALWLTVFDKQGELIALLETFGFQHLDDRAGERRYIKRLAPTADAAHGLSPLDFHTTFGPPAVMITEDQTFVVPIQPAYHATLFPDAPAEQLTLLPPMPHGNALRKAYLCRAGIRRMAPGATMLFYRSEDWHAVVAVGVLEASLVSTDPDAILEFVGTRTVYSSREVRDMATRGSVLALLFRQDRFLEPPITLAELVGARAVSRAPQTTNSINSDGIPWLTARLAA